MIPQKKNTADTRRRSERSEGALSSFHRLKPCIHRSRSIARRSATLYCLNSRPSFRTHICMSTARIASTTMQIRLVDRSALTQEAFGVSVNSVGVYAGMVELLSCREMWMRTSNAMSLLLGWSRGWVKIRNAEMTAANRPSWAQISSHISSRVGIHTKTRITSANFPHSTTRVSSSTAALSL